MPRTLSDQNYTAHVQTWVFFAYWATVKRIAGLSQVFANHRFYLGFIRIECKRAVKAG